MLLKFDEVCDIIHSGVLLHIAGTEALLKKLPKGDWIGGSTDYFMTADGGKISNDSLFVTSFPDMDFKITTYNSHTIKDVTADAYDNGFSIIIIPFESEVHKTYAHNAAGFEGMFIKNIVGWIAGINLGVPGQVPVAVNGQTGVVSSDEAVVLHLCVPDDKTVNIGIVNIFKQDENMPTIEFDEEGFSVCKCRVNGEETIFSDYIAQNSIDTRLPLVGDYSGAGVNISIKTVENDSVSFYAPVFRDIKYRIAKPVSNYAKEFSERLVPFKDTESMFSCNCVLNFLYGELEGKGIDTFHGPITFGEIAYQLVNQTLVYVTILD